jgi:hypothetical protein
MPLLQSGRIFGLYPYSKGLDIPTLEDIALGLSRQPRFAGQTAGLWTVLDHSHFAAAIAMGYSTPTTEVLELALAMLLHDAHEALTGDTPTDLKTEAQRRQQNHIDEVIFNAYFPGGYERYLEIHDQVAKIDHRALLAEARMVGPRPFQQMSGERFQELMGGEPLEQDLHTLRSGMLVGAIGNDDNILEGLESKSAQIYMDNVVEFRRQIEQAREPQSAEA